MLEDQITVELIARTAIELKKLPQYDKRSLQSLVSDAHRFLLECSRVKQMHETGFCTWPEAVRRVTGYGRVRECQLEAFDRFFVDAQLDGDLDRLLVVERQLAVYKEINLVPLRLCDELAVQFPAWQQSELKARKKLLRTGKISKNPPQNHKTALKDGLNPG